MKNGVINVNKEAGMTSFQVVFQIRKLTGEKKCGHTGTLDPDATGVLPVCIGKATKLVDFLMDTDKQYRARMVFGKKTDTQDVSGQVLETMDNKSVHKALRDYCKDLNLSDEKAAETAIRSVFRQFTGEIGQLPPMYSAVKVDGVKLVDAARKGRKIERKMRSAVIYGYEDFSVSGLKEDTDTVTVDFTVNCSKGTYIRTLCEDIGSTLGIPACMERLERTKTSGMDLSSAYRLSEIVQAKEEGRLEDLIIPTDKFLLQYPYVTVRDRAVRKLVFGNYLTNLDFELPPQTVPEKGQIFRVYDGKGTFYALYYYEWKSGQYRCDKMFISVEDEPTRKNIKKDKREDTDKY